MLSFHDILSKGCWLTEQGYGHNGEYFGAPLRLCRIASLFEPFV